MLVPGEETAAQAGVGSIVWAFRRLKKPRRREIVAIKRVARGYARYSVCPQLSFPLPYQVMYSLILFIYSQYKSSIIG